MMIITFHHTYPRSLSIMLLSAIVVVVVIHTNNNTENDSRSISTKIQMKKNEKNLRLFTSKNSCTHKNTLQGATTKRRKSQHHNSIILLHQLDRSTSRHLPRSSLHTSMEIHHPPRPFSASRNQFALTQSVTKHFLKIKRSGGESN